LNEKKKYLFVYLKTGGGHLAPARAIFNYLNKHLPDKVEPQLIYGFEKTPRWVQYIVEVTGCFSIPANGFLNFFMPSIKFHL